MEVPGTVLLAGIVGSTAYGLAGSGSDVDRLGMYAAPTISLVGLRVPRDSHVGYSPDVTYHEAAKAVRLIMDGNPTAGEILWLPDDLYEVRTPLGDELISLRGRLLSRAKVRAAYLGYAQQQARKLLTRDPGDAGTAAKAAKHARHLMRLVTQGHEAYTTGQITVRLADPERYHEFGRRVAEEPGLAGDFMAEAERRFAEARSVLPDEPDREAAEDWLVRVRRQFWTG